MWDCLDGLFGGAFGAGTPAWELVSRGEKNGGGKPLAGHLGHSVALEWWLRQERLLDRRQDEAGRIQGNGAPVLEQEFRASAGGLFDGKA